MKFEEQFPSLAQHTGIGVFMKEEVATREQIQEHCLDKQKVKEAWKKHMSHEYPEMCYFAGFLKELGLSEED